MMVHLVFYMREGFEFGETSKIKLSQERAIFIARKITKHFSGFLITKRQISFTAYKNGHCYHHSINLPKEPDIYILLHEVAHLIDRQKRIPKHDKKFMKLLRKINKFAEKKHYWITTELAIRRTTDLKCLN